MFNPHPPLTSFPVVLLITALFCEMLSYRRRRDFYRQVAQLLFFLGLLAAFVTYLTGYFAAATANATFTVPDALLSQHQASARMLLYLLVPTAILSLCGVAQHSWQRICYLSLLCVSNLLLLWTAYQGGQLVYSYGAGVAVGSGTGKASKVDTGEIGTGEVNDGAVEAVPEREANKLTNHLQR